MVKKIKCNKLIFEKDPKNLVKEERKIENFKIRNWGRAVEAKTIFI